MGSHRVSLIHDMTNTVPTEPLYVDNNKYHNNHCRSYPSYNPEGMNSFQADGSGAWVPVGDLTCPNVPNGALRPPAYGKIRWTSSTSTFRAFTPTGGILNVRSQGDGIFW